MQSALGVIFNKITGVSKIFGKAKSIRAKAGNLASGVAVESGTEVLEEGAGQVARDIGGEGARGLDNIKKGEVLSEGVFSLGQSVATTIIQQDADTQKNEQDPNSTKNEGKEILDNPPPPDPPEGGTPPTDPPDDSGPTEPLSELDKRRAAAEIRTQFVVEGLKRTAEKIKNSNLSRKPKEVLRKTLKNMIKTDIYFDANEWASFWKSRGVSGQQAAKQWLGILPGDYDVVEGGDFKVSAADLLSYGITDIDQLLDIAQSEPGSTPYIHSTKELENIINKEAEPSKDLPAPTQEAASQIIDEVKGRMDQETSLNITEKISQEERNEALEEKHQMGVEDIEHKRAAYSNISEQLDKFVKGEITYEDVLASLKKEQEKTTSFLERANKKHYPKEHKNRKALLKYIQGTIKKIEQSNKPQKEVKPETTALEDVLYDEIKSQMGPALFNNPEDLGLKKKQLEDFIHAKVAAANDAKRQIKERLLEEKKKLESKEYKKLKKEIEEQIDKELEESPLINMRRELGAKKGKVKIFRNDPYAENIPERFKTHKKLGLDRLYSGVRVIQLAGKYDLSPEEIVDFLKNSPTDKQLKERLTQERLEILWPKFSLDTVKLKQDVEASIQNEHKAKLLELELQFLADKRFATFKKIIKKFVPKIPRNKEVKEYVKSKIKQIKVSQLNPGEHLKLQTKYAKKAARSLSEGDLTAAYEYKLKEYYQFEMYHQALKEKKRMEQIAAKSKRMLKQQSDKKLAKTRNIELAQGSRAILSLLGQATQNQASKVFSDIKKIEKFNPDLWGAIEPLITSLQDRLIESNGDPGALTIEEFEKAFEVAEGLWEESRQEMLMQIGEQQLEKEMIKEEIISEIEDKKPQKNKEKNTLGHKFQSLWATLKRMESFCEVADGGKRGPFTKYLFEPIDQAYNRMGTHLTKVMKQIEGILTKDLVQDWNQGKVLMEGIGHTFTDKQELLGALLHIGNESNFKKLTEGYGWDQKTFMADVRTLINKGVLKKKDFDFLQSMWDVYDQMLPQMQKAHKEIYGFNFDEIPTRKIETPFGTYKGGYVPVLYDKDKNRSIELKQNQQMLDNENYFMFPSVSTARTKSRTKYTGKIDFKMTGHLSSIKESLRFIHLAKAVKDVASVIFDSGVDAAIEKYDNTIMDEVIKPWLSRSAMDRKTNSGDGKAVEEFARYWRKVTGASIMAFNEVNFLMQYTGHVITATEVKLKFLFSAHYVYSQDPKAAQEEVRRLSEFMRNRTHISTFDAEQSVRNIFETNSKFKDARGWALDNAYFLQVFAQRSIDTVAWIGAYNQSRAEGKSNDEAVLYADKVVRKTQGSFSSHHISTVEAGSPSRRLMLMFYGFFNMRYNNAYANNQIANQKFDKGEINKIQRDASKLYTFLMLVVIPDLMAQNILGLFGDDEDDEQSAGERFLSKLFVAAAAGFASYFPFVGNIANTRIVDVSGANMPTISGSIPPLKLIENASKIASTKTWDSAAEGDFQPMINAIADIASLGGIPVSKIPRIVDKHTRDD